MIAGTIFLAKEAAGSLRAASVSTTLAVIAIAVAIAAFLVVSAITWAMSDVMGRRYEALGGRSLLVALRHGSDARFSPTARDVADVERLPFVTAAARSVQMTGAASLVSHGTQRRVAQITAVDPDYFDVDQVVLADGRHPRADRNELMMGGALAGKLLGENPIGAHVRVGSSWFSVSGIIRETGEPGRFASLDHAVFVPLQAAERIPGRARGAGRIVVALTESATPESAADPVLAVIARNHRGMLTTQDLMASHKARLIGGARAAKENQAQVASALSLIASFVAGLGVMNLMFLLADERTREIGVRRALGATRVDIAKMFMAEAVLLCAISLPLAIALAVAGIQVATVALELPATPSITLGSVALAVGTASVVVAAFTLLPALRAARADPCLALRSD